MFRRNWGTGLAIGLVTGLGLGLFFLVWAVPEFRNPNYQQSHSAASDQQDAGKEAEEGNQKPEWRYWAERFVALEDTPAQWLMAVFSILATGVSVAAIILVRDTLRETRRSTEIAETALFSEHRPWIDFDLDNFDFGEYRDSFVVTLDLNVKNIGKSPAFGVHISCMHTQSADEVSAAAFAAINEPIEDRTKLPVIIMNTGQPMRKMVGISKSTLEKYASGEYRDIYLVVTITYQPSGFNFTRHTVKTYGIFDTVTDSVGNRIHSPSVTFTPKVWGTDEFGGRVPPGRYTDIRLKTGYRDYT